MVVLYHIVFVSLLLLYMYTSLSLARVELSLSSYGPAFPNIHWLVSPVDERNNTSSQTHAPASAATVYVHLADSYTLATYQSAESARRGRERAREERVEGWRAT